jgi:hypothetical protein
MTHAAGQTLTNSWHAVVPLRPGSTLPPDVALPLASRRRWKRFGVRGLQVQAPVFGRAVEVSDRGARLESPSPLVAGRDYVFRLNYGTRFLDLRGRVAWCRLDRFEPTPRGPRAIFRAGIELGPGEAGAGWRSVLADRAGVALGA